MTYKPDELKRWNRVASVADCPPGSSSEVVVDGFVVALFNVDGIFYALDGVCPHQGGPLGQGELNGCVLTCPWHGWQFNVRTGQHEISPDTLHRTLYTKISDDTVYVAVKNEV